MQDQRPRRKAVARLGSALLLALALFLIGRAIVEIATLNPTRPASYRHDWGGPHYLGVLLVHAVPGAVAAALALRAYRARRTRRHPAKPDPTICGRQPTS